MRDKCWLMMALACLLSSCCQLAVAQVKLAEVKLNTYIGFENPRVVDGVVVAGPNSKPSLASSVSLITVDKPDSYKFGEIEAERIPSFEIVELESVDGGYRFPTDATPGSYRVTYRAFDPERGPATKRITVEVGGAKPVDPIVPPVQPKDDLARLIDEAYRQQRIGHGDSILASAMAIRSGQITKAKAWQEFLEPRTRAARQAANAPIDQFIELNLPRSATDDLDANTAAWVEKLGNAIKAVK